MHCPQIIYPLLLVFTLLFLHIADWNLQVTLGLGHPLAVMLALNQLRLVGKLLGISNDEGVDSIILA